MAAPRQLDRIASRAPAQIEDARRGCEPVGQDLQRADELARALGRIEPSPLVERCVVRADLVEVRVHRCPYSGTSMSGEHPADKLRVEHARTLLATSDLAVKALAADCGFGNPARMKRAFERELGMSPRDYRVIHGS